MLHNPETPDAALKALLPNKTKDGNSIRGHRIRSGKGFAAIVVLFACFPLMPTKAQTTAGDAPAASAVRPLTAEDLPTAQEIWRYLPKLPGRDADASPVHKSNPVVAPRLDSHASGVTAKPRSTLSETRVVIHYPKPAGPDASQDLARQLHDAGVGEVEIRAVGFPVSRHSVRYFYDADRTASETIEDMLGSGRRADVADFTHFIPLPRSGTVEIWLH